MGIHFSSFDKFSDKLETIVDRGPEVVDRFLNQEAEVIKGRVQNNTPVDTGLLRGRWSHTPASGGQCRSTTTWTMQPMWNMATGPGTEDS